MEWINIKVKKPKDTEEVLFTHINIKTPSGEIMEARTTSGYYLKDYFYSWVSPRDRMTATHWMQLPESPKE